MSGVSDIHITDLDEMIEALESTMQPLTASRVNCAVWLDYYEQQSAILINSSSEVCGWLKELRDKRAAVQGRG